MAKDAFLPARLTLARASKHIEDFSAGIDRYFSGQPGKQAVELDQATGEWLWKLQFAESPLPVELNSIAMDAVTNVRDVLDNTVYAAAVAANGKLKHPTKIKFPFGKNLQAVRGNISPEVRRRSQIFLSPLDQTKQSTPASG